MTQPTTPTETLVRVPFSGLTDFQPLALAPGLPMLDVNKLTYQVLLGWFGDLLAEPELDDDGVVFYAQRSGIRQLIVERELATSEELHGTLQPQYEKLKKSLFDVRPVSPSERLIFNRLQPPIGNPDGFLYKVQTESGEEQLVWCWGFQRRTQYGDARLCTNQECSTLFLHDSLAEQQCPHCKTPFVAKIDEEQVARSRFPIGKATAAAAVLMLAGGAFWINSQGPELSAETAPEVAELDLIIPETNPAPSLDLSSENQTDDADDSVLDKPVETSTELADAAVSKLELGESTTEPPELFVGFNDLPVIDELAPVTSPESTAPPLPESTLPPIVSLPDLPETNDSITGDAALPETKTETALKVEKPEPSLPVVKADSFPQEKSEQATGLPDVLPEPSVAQSEPADSVDEEAPATDSVATPPENGTGLVSDAKPIAKPEFSKPDVPESADSIASTEPVETPTAENSTESLPWHSDYLAAYVEASQEKRYLLMLFREAVIGGQPLVSTDEIFAPSMRPMLEQFSRVELPLNAAMPTLSDSSSQTESSQLPDLLLKHRSFRHLGMNPGIAVVDLTDPASLNHARVVSVLPLPENGQFSDDDLMLALNLPKGSIAQRTLLLAIRSTVPDSSLSMREFNSTLIELAHQNSRYMASNGKVGSFDHQSHQQRIEQEFGPQAELKELVFATENKTTIREAALQAVTSWIENSESFDVLDAPATAMGMDMFQNSESGRWFVTCFVVR